MALLNLTKFKKDDGKAASDVPDELPAIPGKAGAAPAQPTAEGQPAADAKPAEGQPSQDEASTNIDQYKDTLDKIKDSSKEYQQGIENMKKGLAPDELPPLTESAESEEQSSQQTAENPSSSQPTLAQASAEIKSMPNSFIKRDQKLYFADLIAKFHDSNQQSAVEKEIISSGSNEIIGNLRTKWDKEKYETTLAEIDKKIIQRMQPLQLLEQEWRTLRTEIDAKTKEIEARNKIIKEKEKLIKETTSELKTLFKEKNHIKSKGLQKTLKNPKSKEQN